MSLRVAFGEMNHCRMSGDAANLVTGLIESYLPLVPYCESSCHLPSFRKPNTLMSNVACVKSSNPCAS